MKKILILGGTGFVGRHVCEKLARLRWSVTVPTRRLDAAQALSRLPGLTPVQADVHDPATLARLVAGHDAVVNLVAILHGDEAAFERTHVTLPRQLAQACVAAGGPRLIHISALGVHAPSSMYLRSKAAGEAALREVAASSALPLTVLRPSVIFGQEDKFLNLFARLQKLLPVLALAGADAQFQPVWVEDVAEAVVRCLMSDLGQTATSGLTYEAFGPEVYTLRELVQQSGRWAGINGGRGRLVIGLPAALGRLQALLMEHLPGPTLMSRDNLDSMQTPNIATGQVPGLDALGIRTAPLAGIAPIYLAGRGPRSDMDRWRAVR